jgi:hypothetical protein
LGAAGSVEKGQLTHVVETPALLRTQLASDCISLIVPAETSARLATSTVIANLGCSASAAGALQAVQQARIIERCRGMPLMLRWGSGKLHGGGFPGVWILHPVVIPSK